MRSLGRGGVLLALWFVVAITACSSFQPELIVKQADVALFRLADTVYPDSDASYRAEIPPPVSFPQLGPQKLVDVLGNLQYQRKGMWSDIEGPVFMDAELSELAAAIHEVLPKLAENERLLVVSRFDADRSVLSRMHLNTMLLWADENGINVVLGLIHEPVLPDNFQMEDDWTKVLPVSLKQGFRDVRLLPGDFFSFKEIDGLKHQTWAVIPLNKLDSLSYERKSDSEGASTEGQTENDAEGQTNPGPADRLRRLQKAFEEGLITAEEYDKKRAAILEEF
ncbi:MAG: SHOCT domain-containing protein [Leptospiraceae bacterium]|nr:SHOCT domain-containing protein [Leptospiraceae bacterium]